MGFTATGDFRLNVAGVRQVALVSRRTVDKIADAVTDAAKSLVPVDTGALRTSIHKEVAADSVTVATATGYGGYVELGTSRMAAQPFMRPALMKVAAQIRGGNL